jgi:hypothetical protein
MSATTKEGFTGPSELIAAAIKASALKFGDRNGSWSRWVVEALTEKLALENPDLLAAIKDLADGESGDHAELLSKVHAELKQSPAFAKEVQQLLARSPRRRRVSVPA